MMIATFEITGQGDVGATARQVRGQSILPAGVVSTVQEIIDDVRERGDLAIIELTRRFDGVATDIPGLEVPAAERESAWNSLDGGVREALERAEIRIALFSRESIASDWEREISPGVKVGQLQRPLETAGIYVPGGRYAYPSTVLMTGVPAREAGVGKIVFCIPPGRDGSINTATLAATWLVGECRVFRVGGAQAVAAMAMGTHTIPRCRMVAGPGNIYVTAAKRLLAGLVSIDLEAGPSEIAAYVDGSVDLSFPGADVLAQLEHDPLSLAVMVSESGEVLETASGVLSGLEDEGVEKEGLKGTVSLVRCASRDLAISFLNELAPEHLEIMVEGASGILPEIISAGCVLVGPYSAVVLGDYLAGPSHVLPTGGTAGHTSGLDSQRFRRKMNLVHYTRDGFMADAEAARILARLEGLEKHALSVDIRMRK